MSYVYLAQPYSDPNIRIMEKRYRDAMEWIANHMKVYRQPVIYAPIVHFHEIAKRHKMPTDAAYWEAVDFSMIKSASALWVLKLDGWQNSKGINGDPETGAIGELKFAEQIRKPVKFIDP